MYTICVVSDEVGGGEISGGEFESLTRAQPAAENLALTLQLARFSGSVQVIDDSTADTVEEFEVKPAAEGVADE